MKTQPRICENCQFHHHFNHLTSTLGYAGECRKKAPIITKQGHTKFPGSFPGHWCGEWEVHSDYVQVYKYHDLWKLFENGPLLKVVLKEEWDKKEAQP